MSTINNDNKFPDGLRVLVVDDNVNCLKLLSMNLHECKYKVTAITEATIALELLRKNKDDYDILIIQTKLLDMDAFEFLKIINLEIDIPFIIISESDDKGIIFKSLTNGAQDYLVKPVRIEVLRNIWQHVLRKKLSDPSSSTTLINPKTPIIRKRENDTEEEECSPKRPRVTWTKPLQDKFVDVVNKLGSKAVPKKIMAMMNEPQLSCAHISSHLQNYRNVLRKGKMKSVDTNSTNIEQPIASTSILTPNPCTWNKFNGTNIRYVPNNALFCAGPTNNHYIGLQPYTAPPNSFGVVNIPSTPPPTNDQNSIEVMPMPIPSLGQNEDNWINFNPSQIDLQTKKIETPLHMENRIDDENQWTENSHMRSIQEELEKNIDFISFDENSISLMMKELSEMDHLIL